MLENNDAAWEEPGGKELQPFGEQPVILPVPSVDHSLRHTDELQNLSQEEQALLHDGQWRAFHDARELEGAMNGGQSVRIDRMKIDARIKAVVDQRLGNLQKNNMYGGPPPDKFVYQRYIGICGKAYWERFSEEVDLGNVGIISTPQEARLREVALADRKSAPSDHQQTYVRDLAVVRVLQELAQPLEKAAENLATVHALAEKYYYYYAHTREEVIWPSQTSF